MNEKRFVVCVHKKGVRDRIRVKNGGTGKRTREERRRIANRVPVFSGIILKRICIMGYRRSFFEWGITCQGKSNFGNPKRKIHRQFTQCFFKRESTQ